MKKEELIKSIEKGILASEMAVNFKMHDLNLYDEINKLENKGYTLHRTYYSDGQFKYEFGADNKKNLTGDIDIITKPNEKVVKLVAMSDMHYTSEAENRTATHVAYKHAKDNDIHVILIPGDLLHGKFSSVKENFKPGLEQIETFLSDFPFDNDIIIIGTGGDHDESIYKYDHIDPLKVITKARHNIVLPGYFRTVVRIKNSKIVLEHRNKAERYYSIQPVTDYQVELNGHFHEYSFLDENSKVVINVPTTSSILTPMSSFLELTLTYNDQDFLQRVEAKQFGVLNGKEVYLGRSSAALTKPKETFRNIENYKHKEVTNPYPYKEIPDNDTLVVELQEDNAEKTKRLETLEDEYSIVNAENERNKKINEALNSTLSSTEERTRQLDLVVDQLRTDNSYKSEKMCDLKNDNKKLKKNNFDLVVTNKELEEERKDLLKQLKEAKALIQQYEETIKAQETLPTEVTEEITVEIIESFDDTLDEVKDNLREKVNNETTQKKRKKELKQNKFDFSQRSKSERIEELRNRLRK